MRGSKPILRRGRNSPDIAWGFQFDSDFKSAIVAICQSVQPFHPGTRGGKRRYVVRMIDFQKHDIAAHNLMAGAVFAAVITDRLTSDTSQKLNQNHTAVPVDNP